ncbi:MAG: hypothetical protein MZU95_00900 [Desulfomicrobium escambiense]|nr:hypothetical protein [Desulfomicrobium escambiense]
MRAVRTPLSVSSQSLGHFGGLRPQGLGLEKPRLGRGEITRIQGFEALRHPPPEFLCGDAGRDALQACAGRLGLRIQPQGLLEIQTGRQRGCRRRPDARADARRCSTASACSAACEAAGLAGAAAAGRGGGDGCCGSEDA